MFAWKEKSSLGKVEKACAIDPQPNGVNRRAIGLLPLPENRDQHKISRSEALRYKQLLLTIEARQSSCCLRIIATSRKARSAILIYKGRVIGCLHGSKHIGQQIFGEDAHREALVDLAHPENIVDAYLLSEDIVLAAASLFHGQVLKISPAIPAAQSYVSAIQNLASANSVGCVVISNQDSCAVCMVYVFSGRIVGVYSFADGWLPPTLEAGLEKIHLLPGAKIMASALTAKNECEAVRLTFSLTGLNEQHVDLETTRRLHDRVLEKQVMDCTPGAAAVAEHIRTQLQISTIEFKQQTELSKQCRVMDDARGRHANSDYSIYPSA
jgi:hypothetical protein